MSKHYSRPSSKYSRAAAWRQAWAAVILLGGLLAAVPAGAEPSPLFDQAVTAYETGDYVRARGLWERALAAGDWDAARSLGTLYRRGLGVGRDDARAVAYYRTAVDHGVVNAYANLAEMMLAGRGTARDTDGGIALLRRASEAGSGMARLRLREIEEARAKGLPPPPLPER